MCHGLRQVYDTNLEVCFNAGRDIINENGDTDGFLQIGLPPFIIVFPRFNRLQNLEDCPHLEHLIPIVVANCYRL